MAGDAGYDLAQWFASVLRLLTGHLQHVFVEIERNALGERMSPMLFLLL